MKVGDIVRQNGKMVNTKGSKLRVNTEMTGIIIEMSSTDMPRKHETWQKWLGASVAVLWSNGRLTKNIAENALEVVNEAG